MISPYAPPPPAGELLPGIIGLALIGGALLVGLIDTVVTHRWRWLVVLVCIVLATDLTALAVIGPLVALLIYGVSGSLIQPTKGRERPLQLAND